METDDIQNNHPLVIEGDGGVGKKTLLAKWYDYHQTIKPKVKNFLFLEYKRFDNSSFCNHWWQQQQLFLCHLQNSY